MTITPELEAVARAIFAARYKRENEGLNTNITWNGMPATSHENYYAQARAALMAIREPTDGMHHAVDLRAETKARELGKTPPAPLRDQEIYAAMIDYILSETKP